MRIAIIDDEEYWLDWIENKILQEKLAKEIKTFKNLHIFMKYEDIKSYDVIICDYLFGGYNFEDTKLSYFSKDKESACQLIILTNSKEDVIKQERFHAVIHKATAARNDDFLFSKYLRGADVANG